MENAQQKNGLALSPKLQLLEKLLKLCYFANVTNSQYTGGNNNGTVWCPRKFDGFTCWDETPAGAIAYQNCPGIVIGFDTKRIAYKRCLENGTWFQHPDLNRSWTNYTTCIDMDDLKFRSFVNDIYVAGYIFSTVALVISLAIFKYYRSLRCTRVKIHMHLFTSFILGNIFWIVWYKTVVNSATVVQQNKVWCQSLHLATNYFMVTNYFWMFCEGLHLHLSVVVVFRKDDLAMTLSMVIGWGFSLVIIIVYGAVRYITGATERCWIEQNYSFWVIITPVVISMIASAVFLVNVIRVLVTKLNPPPNQNFSVTTRKATKAALILIPLFGLHFLLIPLQPSPEASGERVYQVASALLTTLQGVCVATLFCFSNSDVILTIRTHIERVLRTYEDLEMIGVATGGEDTRENIV